MLRGILGDNNVEGQIEEVVQILESPRWKGLWHGLRLQVCDFDDFGLSESSSDRLIWTVCQQEQLVLVTANRNQAGRDSLETTIRELNTYESFTVLTIGKVRRLYDSRDYAERVAVRMLEILMDIEFYRGAGRLYLP